MDTFKVKKGLGRGLSSLIGDVKPQEKVNKVLIGDLVRNKYQPRKIFNKDSLQELSDSIKERGIIQPIVVRPLENDKNKFEIIAGERRWIAAQNAGLNEVPVVVLNIDNLKSLEFAIVENVQRANLNPIEEANGYQIPRTFPPDSNAPRKPITWKSVNWKQIKLIPRKMETNNMETDNMETGKLLPTIWKY